MPHAFPDNLCAQRQHGGRADETAARRLFRLGRTVEAQLEQLSRIQATDKALLHFKVIQTCKESTEVSPPPPIVGQALREPAWFRNYRKCILAVLINGREAKRCR